MKTTDHKAAGAEKLAPREFLCRTMGNDCSWKHVARTEDLLLDAAALHLRDIHGVASLGSEAIAKIRNSFSNPSRPVTSEADIPVMKEFRCKDIGMSCEWKYFAQTEELIVDGAAVHARDAHGIMAFTPDMIARVKNAIHPW